jgi:hypothetical protein
MNCNVHVFYKMIFSNKFGLIWKQVFSYIIFSVLPPKGSKYNYAKNVVPFIGALS